MAIEGHLAIGQTLGNIAVSIVAVPNIFAATKTGNVLQGCFVVDNVEVGLLDL
jgi:hypothetical protein